MPPRPRSGAIRSPGGPANPRAHQNYGRVELKHGRVIAEAERHYQQALRLRPRHAEARSNDANLLLKTGRSADALPHAEEAVDLEPARAEIQFNAGNAQAAAGRYEEALARHRAAVALQPVYPEAHLNLGHTLAALERDAQAVESFARAVDQRPSYLLAPGTLARWPPGPLAPPPVLP
jgi:tetratricopeptide (TPR) repeat protein